MKKVASLLTEIEFLRERLNTLITLYGEKNESVLHCSQELDKLIYEYQKSNKKIKKGALRASNFQIKRYCLI